MATPAEFVSVVRSFEGTPFHLHGRQPGVAMDCPAPLIVGAWMLGLKPRSFDITGYAADPDGVTLQRLCNEHLQPVQQAQVGDVLLTAWAQERMRPRHLGVLVDATPGRMWWVQAEGHRYKAVKLCRLMFGVDRMHLVQAYRVPGVA